jgi:hypothetical protein
MSEKGAKKEKKKKEKGPPNFKEKGRRRGHPTLRRRGHPTFREGEGEGATQLFGNREEGATQLFNQLVFSEELGPRAFQPPKRLITT